MNTYEEIKEKYDNVELVFSSYYKYMFTFRGEFEGGYIYVNVGGCSDDIYRMNVTADEYEYLDTLEGDETHITVYNDNEEKIMEYYK